MPWRWFLDRRIQGPRKQAASEQGDMSWALEPVPRLSTRPGVRAPNRVRQHASHRNPAVAPVNTRLLSIIHQQEFDLEGSPENRWHECLESRRHGGRRQSRQCPTRRGDQLRVDRRRRRPLAVAHLSVQPREPKPRPAKDRLQPAGAKSLRPHRNRTTGLAAASHPEGRGPERRPHRRHPHRDHPQRQ